VCILRWSVSELPKSSWLLMLEDALHVGLLGVYGVLSPMEVGHTSDLGQQYQVLKQSFGSGSIESDARK